MSTRITVSTVNEETGEVSTDTFLLSDADVQELREQDAEMTVAQHVTDIVTFWVSNLSESKIDPKLR